MQSKTARTTQKKKHDKKVEKGQAKVVVTPSKFAIINILEAEKKGLQKQIDEIENYLKELKGGD